LSSNFCSVSSSLFKGRDHKKHYKIECALEHDVSKRKSREDLAGSRAESRSAVFFLGVAAFGIEGEKAVTYSPLRFIS
jgi:hypothetical protein